MACKYCFYCDVMAQREVENYGMMSDITLETMVKSALAECEEACSFAFQGGEPTLAGLGYYRKLIELQKKYNMNNVQISNAIQTNGILIDDEWAAFFKENNFLVGLSLDGDKDIHDAARDDRAGKGTYLRVMKAAELLEKHGVDFNILCVVTSYAARSPEKLYNFYKKQGFKYLQFIPCIDGFEAGEEGFWSLSSKRYATFLKGLFDCWYADCKKYQGVSIRHFDNWLGLLLGYPPENCAMGGRCAVYFVVEADGSVYPCDFYVTDEWKIGDIGNGSFAVSFADMQQCETARRFAGNSANADCASCEYYFMCRGGCRRDREPIEQNAVNRFCEAYKEFFAYSLERLKDVARQDRHPYGINQNAPQ